MATITRVPMQIITSVDKLTVREYPEANSQTFKKGEFVYLASGYVTVCTSDSGIVSETILGVALQDGQNVTTKPNTLVAIADDNLLLEMNVSHGSTPTTAITNVGVAYGAECSSNKWYCKLDSTNDVVEVQALSPKDAVGDTYGRVIVKVIPSKRMLISGA